MIQMERKMDPIKLNLNILLVSTFVNFIFALYNLWIGEDMFFVMNIIVGVIVGMLYLRNKRMYDDIKEKTWRSYR